MNATTGSLSEMVNQSITVLTRPSVQTFETYEKRGTMQSALIYIAAAAAIAGIVAFVFGLFAGIGAAIGALVAAVIGPLVSFAVFAFLLFYIGRSQGGSGTRDEVFYTTALYAAPILAVTGAVSNIPLINCLALPATLLLGLYQIYLAYLSTRASQNLDQNKAILTIVLAWLAQFLISLALTAIFAGIFFANAQ
jgi:hypothetical protein